MERSSRRPRALARFWWPALLGLLAVIVGATGPASGSAAAESASAQAPSSYVALGDSFTAGPLITAQTGEPWGCLRSNQNYPRLVASQTGVANFRDVSCSGASTRHMFEPHNAAGGPNPPQLDALNETIDLVTLGIGGNDIGFSGIIEDCVSLLPFGSPCRDEYTSDGDELSERIAETAPKVSNVLAAIGERAPDAEILVVGYPAIFPHSGRGCWPSLPVAWGDVPYLRAKQEELNAMLADRAAAHGATYVDTYGPSEGRDACAASGTRWVEPLVPSNLAAPVHPNARGMAGMAVAVQAEL